VRLAGTALLFLVLLLPGLLLLAALAACLAGHLFLMSAAIF